MSEDLASIASAARHFEYQLRIAVLAHRFYEEENCPDGRALDHWLRAEQEVRRAFFTEDKSDESSSG